MLRFPGAGSECEAERADTAIAGGVCRGGWGTGNLPARVNKPLSNLQAVFHPLSRCPPPRCFLDVSTPTPSVHRARQGNAKWGGMGGRGGFAGEADGEHPCVPARLRACVVAPGSPRRAVLRGAGRQPQRRGGSPQGQRRQRRLPGLAGLQRQRPDAPLPHRLHPRADRPAGEGVLPGELRVQTPEM